MLDRPMQYYLAHKNLCDTTDNPFILGTIKREGKRYKAYINFETGDYFVIGGIV